MRRQKKRLLAQETTGRIHLVAPIVVAAVVLLSLALQARAAQSGLEVRRLAPGAVIEREIAGGQTHAYRFKLKSTQFLRVLVEQKGIDVALVLTGPDGKQLIESDLTGIIGARESLSYEARAAGVYQIVVRANGAAAQSGAYQARLDLKPSASAQDRKRIAAELLLNQARRLLTQNRYTDPQLREKLAQAAALWRELDDPYWQAFALNALGLAYHGARQSQQSIESYEQALAAWREEKLRAGEATALNNLGNAYQRLSRYDKAVEYYAQVLPIRRELQDRAGEAANLSDLGDAYQRLGRLDKAMECYTQALAINQELNNRREQGVSLKSIGWVNYRLGQQQKAIEYNEQALAIAREVKNRADEGSAIAGLASAYGGLKQYEKALEYGEQSLLIERELKDRIGEAGALNNLAIYHRGLLHFEKAIEYYEQAQATFHAMQERQDEALCLRNLGDLYTAITRLDKAVESYERALPIYREIKDRQGEAFVLGPLANVYNLLGRPEKSIEYFSQALPINREFKNRLREAGNLNGLGDANDSLGRYEKAVEFYEQALGIAREFKIRGQEGAILSNLGDAYKSLGNYDKAIDYARQALVINRETKNRNSEAYSLNALGAALRLKGQYQEAAQNYEQALRLARELRSRLIEGQALQGLMLNWQAQNKLGLAVFFGKQAVNLYQEIRGELVRLEKESQQSYVKSKEDAYRTLADLLIAEGRLPEAEQVMNLLKQEEYFDFIRRDSSNAPQANRAQMTPEEAALEKRYREIAEQIAALGSERGSLLDKKKRTAEEDQRLARIDADLVLAGNTFQTFLSRLESELSGSSETSSKVFALRESQGMMEDLRELGAGTVALYTVVGEDKYRLILTTPDFQKGYEYPIKAADLNRKVLDFREALQNPKLDPLPMAQELYRILLGPAAKDLQKVKPRIVMWSLDGVLRYVPVSALHDGKQYMVERFANVVFTPASQARLKDAPAAHWDALGLGVTKAHGERIPALPGVAEEMRGIIRNESESDAEGAANQIGVLPGVVKLDEQFTQDAMLAELRKRHKVVHIASHFQFSPGNETNSALLLGDGTFLSLAQIKSLPNVFGGVDLLTLSACNTATGGAANGKEVEGFGVLAQRQGAKSVVASLWPVADRSTKLLMQDFYKLREAQSGVSKAEALRQAQMRLLRGADSPEAASEQSRQLTHEEEKPGAAKRPLFKTDARAPFGHPYYWAPFILIGNWK